MPGNFTTSSVESSEASPLPKAWSWLWLTRYFTLFWPVLFILASFNTAIRSAVVLPKAIPTHSE